MAVGLRQLLRLPAQQGPAADRDAARSSCRRSSGAEPVRYAGVLVAFEEGTYSEDAMATALKLAAHKGGDVRVIATVTVPQHLDIDAPLPEAEATAQAVIEAARQWAGRGQRVRGPDREGAARTRPGHRIVREAIEARSRRDRDADAARAGPSGKVLSKTLEVVLGKRPCRVIIDSVPAEPLRERAAPAAGRVEPTRSEAATAADAYRWCFNRGGMNRPSLRRGDAAPRLRRDAFVTIERGVGTPRLFATAYSTVGSSIYFALGVVAAFALGLTPLVFLVAGLLFVVTTLTYFEGMTLHPERGGSAVMARYAFNELLSFIAGWAILLDFLILIAISTLSIGHYLTAFWCEFGDDGVDLAIALLRAVRWSPATTTSARRRAGGARSRCRSSTWRWC